MEVPVAEAGWFFAIPAEGSESVSVGGRRLVWREAAQRGCTVVAAEQEPGWAVWRRRGLGYLVSASAAHAVFIAPVWPGQLWRVAGVPRRVSDPSRWWRNWVAPGAVSSPNMAVLAELRFVAPMPYTAAFGEAGDLVADLLAELASWEPARLRANIELGATLVNLGNRGTALSYRQRLRRAVWPRPQDSTPDLDAALLAYREAQREARKLAERAGLTMQWRAAEAVAKRVLGERAGWPANKRISDPPIVTLAGATVLRHRLPEPTYQCLRTTARAELSMLK